MLNLLYLLISVCYNRSSIFPIDFRSSTFQATPRAASQSTTLNARRYSPATLSTNLATDPDYSTGYQLPVFPITSAVQTRCLRGSPITPR